MINFSKNIIKFCIVLFIIGISLFFSETVKAASLYFSPSSGSYSVGRSFTVSVYLSSPDQAINAVSGTITFPQDKLQVVSLSKIGSIVNLWVKEPSFSNITGTVNFEEGGVVWSPGYTGNNGKVFDIVFVTKSHGTVSLNLSSASAIAYDTDVLSGLGSASYTITDIPTITVPPLQTIETRVPKAVKILSTTHPDSDKWYSAGTATFSWDLTDDITEARLLISRNSGAVPSVNYRPPINSKTITNLEEGIWYFYVQLKNSYGWGDVARFRLQIDNTPPGPLDIRIDDEGNPANTQPLLWFKTDDSLSGLDFYNVEIGEIYNLQVSPEEVAQGFYRIPPCPPGRYLVTIKAVDKVGRYSSATAELIIKSSVIIDSLDELTTKNPLGGTKFAYLGRILISNFSIFIVSFGIVLLFLIILGIVSWLYYCRNKYSQKKLKEEAEKTEFILYQAFDNLRKEVTRQIAKLDGNDLLSTREEEIDDKLKKAIRNSERLIDEKLKKIKRELDRS